MLRNVQTNYPDGNIKAHTQARICACVHTHTHSHTPLLLLSHNGIEDFISNDSNIFISMAYKRKVITVTLKGNQEVST